MDIEFERAEGTTPDGKAAQLALRSLAELLVDMAVASHESDADAA